MSAVLAGQFFNAAVALGCATVFGYAVRLWWKDQWKCDYCMIPLLSTMFATFVAGTVRAGLVINPRPGSSFWDEMLRNGTRVSIVAVLVSFILWMRYLDLSAHKNGR